MKRSMLALLIAVVSTGAAANSYQNESSVDYINGDINNVDVDAWQLKHQYFFNAVDTSGNTPRAEAAFINKNSSVFGTLSRINVDHPLGDTDLNGWSVGGEYMDQSHNFYGKLEWLHYSGTDYQEVDGVKFPMTLTIKNPMLPVALETKMKTVSFNQQLSDADFQ